MIDNDWEFLVVYRFCEIYKSKRSRYYGVNINGLWISPFRSVDDAENRIDCAWESGEF